MKANLTKSGYIRWQQFKSYLVSFVSSEVVLNEVLATIEDTCVDSSKPFIYEASSNFTKSGKSQLLYLRPMDFYLTN